MITKCFATVHQCGNYGMLAGWVAMRTGDYIDVGRSMFTVYHMAQQGTISPINISVQERKIVISFHLYGELGVLVET
jgi:hypothetical protein